MLAEIPEACHPKVWATLGIIVGIIAILGFVWMLGARGGGTLLDRRGRDGDT